MGHIFFLCPPAVRGSLTLDPTMRVMWGKKGDGGFLRVLNPFF